MGEDSRGLMYRVPPGVCVYDVVLWRIAVCF